MQVTGQPRGRLVTTYARRKGRSRVFNVSSSPIKASDGEDLTLAEVTQRMKKRARQSNPILDLGTYTEFQNVLKRPKNTHALAPSLHLDSNDNSSITTLDSLISLNDETNNLQYQTPFNLSPANSPTAPDPMSPVPPSRPQLARIGSCNLKENRSIKRLASPFHSRSVSRACSRSGSRANSPKMKIKKPPFYVKARTRSEANVAQSVENVSEVLFPISGSLPTLGSMKSGVCDTHGSTYMQQDFSELDWFRPPKALSHSPFSEDYVPPGTPFHGWDYTSEAFFGGVPLQTSTPIVTNGPMPRYMHTEGTPSAPNTPENDHDIANSRDITCETKGSRRPRRHVNRDSIFSSFSDDTTMLSTFEPIDQENTLGDDNRPSSGAYLSDNGQTVTNLSGMLNSLDICGSKTSSVNFAHRSRSLDSASTTVAPVLLSDTQQATGRKRDRASTIRASDYMIKPAIVAPCGRETSTTVIALTTRTRSGTIRPAHPPSVPPADSFPGVEQHVEQALVDNSVGLPIITDEDRKPSERLDQAQSHPGQVTRIPGANVETVEDMVTDADYDESDDELLLDRKGWNWDGKWE